MKKSWRTTFRSRELFILVALALLVVVVRLPSLERPFHNDCGAIAYHARLIVRGEPLYGTHHPNHHLPAAYYVYALAFALLGDSVWAVKSLLVVWTIVVAYLVYRLGAQVTGAQSAGVMAAVFYAVLSSHPTLLGDTAEIELFANLPRTAAVLALTSLTLRRSAPWKYALVGVFGAAAFLFKAVYLSPLALAGCVLLRELWQTRCQSVCTRTVLLKGLWIALGVVAGVLPVVLYFGSQGLLPRLLLVFSMGRRYVQLRNVASGGIGYVLLNPFVYLGENNVPLMVYSLAGVAAVAVDRLLGRRRGGRGDRTQLELYATLWYALSVVEAGITRVKFSHYYLLVIPALAIVAAGFLHKIHGDRTDRLRVGLTGCRLVLAPSLVAAALLYSALLNLGHTRHYLAYKLGSESYEDFVSLGVRDGPELLHVQQVSDYIAERTLPSPAVYYWSGYTQLYYLADRRCAIDVIWPMYAEATGPYQRIFSPDTAYIVLGETSNLPRPDWLYQGLDDDYVLEAIIGDEEVYRRTS